MDIATPTADDASSRLTCQHVWSHVLSNYTTAP